MSGTLAEIGTWRLRHIEMFQLAASSVLERLSRLLHVREYSRGETIYLVSGHGAQALGRVYFVFTGSAKISSIDAATGKELILMLVKAGEPFGLLNRVINEQTDLRATAAQHSLVGFVARTDFDDLVAEAGAGARLRKVIDKRVFELVSRLEDLVFRSVKARLANLLLRLACDFPKERDCGTCIDFPLTQQDIANLVGARREVVSTHLTEFRRSGVVVLHEKHYCVHDRDALAKMVQ